MSECEHKHTGSCSPAGVYLYVKCMDCGAILNESEDGRRLRAGCPGFKAERYASGSCEHCHHDAQYHCDSLRSRLADLEAERALIIQRAENAEAALEICDLLRIEAMNAWLAAAALLRDIYSYAEDQGMETLMDMIDRIDAHLAREQKP